MACFHPISAYQLSSGEVKFIERGDVIRTLQLPCGRCAGCRLERSRQWAVRCMHEASLYEGNEYVTLTYSPEGLLRMHEACKCEVKSVDSLCYYDFQCFMKRLRKRAKARFFACGEYGEEDGRPHFHACLFGLRFVDRRYWKRSPSKSNLYRSAELEALWPHGYSTCGDVTFESAAYVARYIMDKMNGDLAKTHYRRIDKVTGEIYWIKPEMCQMSRGSGIGLEWIRKYWPEVIANDGKVVINGVAAVAPKYYMHKMRGERRMEDIEYKRYLGALRYAGENTDERLAVREIVANARLSLLKREKV